MTRGKEVLLQTLRTGDDETELEKTLSTITKQRREVSKKLESIEKDILTMKKATHEDIIESIALLETFSSDLNSSSKVKVGEIKILQLRAKELIKKLKSTKQRKLVINLSMELGSCKEKIGILKKAILHNKSIVSFIPDRIAELKIDEKKIGLEIKELQISLNYRRKHLKRSLP